MNQEIEYQSGWGNEFSSEALPHSLPVEKNNPQKVPKGLYAEQLSGSAFTAYPEDNLRTWLYKAAPSVDQSPYQLMKQFAAHWYTPPHETFISTPERLRWDPLPVAKNKADFVESIFTVAANGDVNTREGSSVHLYCANQSMDKRAFQNNDAEMLIVPQEGGLTVRTEMGVLKVKPTEILLVPRGVKFKVKLETETARGYICENFGAPFQLPYRGPIGANGLASRRHFLAPHASFETQSQKYELITKFQGAFWQAQLESTPFDVVAWTGNYVPYKYDLNLYNTIGSISFDHPDPSIFTVLTSPGSRAGMANVDFVIFPPRWLVAEDTFRPPYFHRNVMNEYMGLVKGVYDAKPAKGGFIPGGGSLHNCHSPHGPELEAYSKSIKQDLKPEKLDDTLAIMFESSWVYKPSKQALESQTLQKDYIRCWQGFQRTFHS